MANIKVEQLLDKVAEAIVSVPEFGPTQIETLQKTIRNGIIQTGRGIDGRLVLYQTDLEANKQDLLQSGEIIIDDDTGETITGLEQLANRIDDINQITVTADFVQQGGDEGNQGQGQQDQEVGGEFQITISGDDFGEGEDVTDYFVGQGNPLNLSQFIPVRKKKTIVNKAQANEFLDTNIFELLPSTDTRQARINRFFQELNALLPPETPQFDKTGDDNMPDGFVDRAPDGTWISASFYNQDNSIVYAQENVDSNIDEEEAFIHRLKSTSNNTNSSATIQDIYNRVLPYLTDILEAAPIPEDDRPEYVNQGTGFLKFRNPNQGIVIRNTSQEFIEGLDPNNPTWLTSNYAGLQNIDPTSDRFGVREFINENPGTGFTITMWVRFLDKSSEGTLFNFGNPTRDENPFGFRLETYVVDKDDECPHEGFDRWYDAAQELDPEGHTIFQESNKAHFVRLVARIGDPTTSDPEKDDHNLKDSHLGMKWSMKFAHNIGEGVDDPDYDDYDELKYLQTTHIPQNFQEWYFICASFNPNVVEPGKSSSDPYNEIFEMDGIGGVKYKYDSDFWLNNINPITEEYVSNASWGNMCKVEMISRTDLLRARGFKVD